MVKQQEEKEAPGQRSSGSWGLYTLGPAVNIRLAPSLQVSDYKDPGPQGLFQP